MNTAKIGGYSKLVLDGLNHLLWPAVCFNCKSSISEDSRGLCDECWDGIQSCIGSDYCPRCGRDVSRYAITDYCPLCENEQYHFDGIARAGVYAKSFSQLILKFKHDQTELQNLLGNLVKIALETSNFAEEIDIFTPVPLHWLRRFSRGYNQSLLIAKAIRPKDIKISTDLVRIRYTEQQAGCNTFSQRAKNVEGAFAVRKGNHFKGKTICLVDDIKTSGATLNECAKVIKDAGAAKVYAAVIAVAGQDKWD